VTRRQREHLIALPLLILSLVVFWFAVRPREIKITSSPSPTPTTSSVSPTPTPSPIQDPIQIEAIRQRTYTASPILLEQTLSTSGGYTNQIVSYQSDGLKIYANLATPTGAAPPGGWPVIVLNHGYSDPATYQTNGTFYQPFVAAFARAGYVVIKPDYRGHGRSQGTAEGGHFSPVYAYDDLNLLASLEQYPGINKDRIGLFGHSMGGHVNLRTMVTSSQVKATVMLAGVVGTFDDILYNWPNSPMAGDRPTALVSGKRQALLAKFGDPKTNPDFWNSASGINFVSTVRGPVFIAHSINDSTVPKSFSDHLNQALKVAGKSVEYKLYPGDDHLFSVNRAQMFADTIAFYKANL